MSYASKVGHLQAAPQKSGGKIVDTWTFWAPELKPKGGAHQIPVQVVLTKGPDGLTFLAKSDALDKPISHPNIEELRKLVEGRIGFLASIRAGVVWEDWLEVKVTSYDTEGNHTNRAQLTLEVTPIKRGVMPSTGEVFTCISNGMYAMPFPKSKRAGEPVERELMGEVIRTDSPAEVSYVPATPENIAALDDARERLRQLRARLSEVLSQDAIQHTLADLSNRLPMLGNSAAEAAAPASNDRQ